MVSSGKFASLYIVRASLPSGAYLPSFFDMVWHFFLPAPIKSFFLNTLMDWEKNETCHEYQDFLKKIPVFFSSPKFEISKSPFMRPEIRCCFWSTENVTPRASISIKTWWICKWKIKLSYAIVRKNQISSRRMSEVDKTVRADLATTTFYVSFLAQHFKG